MALFRKPKVISYTDANPNAIKDIPFSSPITYPEIGIEFVNASVEDDYERDLLLALMSIDKDYSAPTISETNLPSIATHKGTLENGKDTYNPVPIFIGSPTSPNEQFLYFNPDVRQYKPSFFSSLSTDCVTSFLFAEIKPVVSTNRGVYKSVKTIKEAPYSVEVSTSEKTLESTQLIFTNQRDTDIEIRSLELIVTKLGNGIQIVSDIPVVYDTWYDGSWEAFSIAGVGAGYTNIVNKTGNKYDVSTRYSWSYGSIFLTKYFGGSDSISPDFGLREINYEYANSEVKLIGWKYSLNDTYTGKNNQASIIGSVEMNPEDSLKIYGRQLITFFMKSFEEGRGITINEKNGGIEIGVNFFHNGNCCECEGYSSSSSSILDVSSDSSSSSDSSHSSTSSSSESSSSSSSSESSSSLSSDSSSSESSSSSLDNSQSSLSS